MDQLENKNEQPRPPSQLQASNNGPPSGCEHCLQHHNQCNCHALQNYMPEQLYDPPVSWQGGDEASIPSGGSIIGHEQQTPQPSPHHDTDTADSEVPLSPRGHSTSDNNSLSPETDQARGRRTSSVVNSNAAKSRSTTATERLKSFFAVWWLELLACLVALGSLFAVVGTTYSRQNLPLPRWPYNLQVTTLIAIYIGALKAAILLIASQGKILFLGHAQLSCFLS